MQIQQVNIERFGRQEELHLDRLTEGLNVIYGPEGSGKTTVLQFIRWMLHAEFNENGWHDRGRHAGSLPAEDLLRSSAGSLTFRDAGRCYRLSRREVDHHQELVALDGDARHTSPALYLSSLRGHLLPREFDLLYAPQLADEHGLHELLQSAVVQEADVAGEYESSRGLQELRSRIEHYRWELERLPQAGDDLTRLLTRKQELERLIDRLTSERRRRRIDGDRGHQEISQRIQATEAEIDRLQAACQVREEEVNARRRELERAWNATENTRREYLESRKTELADVEQHLSRARGMQSELQRRQNALEAQLRASDLQLDRSAQETEQAVCLVQSIAKQLDDMRLTNPNPVPPEEEYHRWGSAAARHAIFRQRGSAAAAHTTWETLRAEVGRLCTTLQNERGADRVRAIAEELGQLRQTDEAMHRWVTGLEARQDQLARELEALERHGVSVVYNRAATDLVDRGGILATSLEDRLRGVQHSCEGIEPVHPADDPLLRQLYRDRDVADEDLRACERKLNQLLDRHREWEADSVQRVEREREAAEREHAELDSHLRTAEMRERLLRQISHAERELERVRDVVQVTPVSEHTARIFARLTRGHYRDVHLQRAGQVCVTDVSGTLVPVSRLDQETRARLYLSLCLAVITAVRRRGIRLPFLLRQNHAANGGGFDSVQAQVLREFAQMGQQVCVFTWDAEVVRHLQEAGASVFELVRRSHLRRQATESREQVRFRPRTEPRYLTGHVASTRQEHYPDHHWVPGPNRPSPFVGERYHDTYSPPSNVPPPLSHDQPRPGDRADRRPLDLENVTFENDPPAGADHGEFLTPSASLRSQAVDREAPSGLVDRDATRLTHETRIELCGIMEADVASRLRAFGVVTVGDFVMAAADELQDHLHGWGFESLPIRRWQDQLRLRCEVPGINVDDARLLAACGISSAESLAHVHVASLGERIWQLLSTRRDQSGTRYMAPRSHDHRDRIGRWVQAAQAALQGDGVTIRDRAVSGGNGSRPSAPRSSDTEPKNDGQASASAGRFYLHPNDPVVDAPTIGPRTADRLRRAGLRTVGDLIRANPEALAERIDDHRIAPDDIRDWQTQSVLACRIPQLRGHDARVLVACGVTSAEQLADYSPDQLWETIRPFTKTRECKRIIRNGKTPDLKEVTSWIRSARRARSLQFA